MRRSQALNFGYLGNRYIVEPAPQEIPQKGFGGDLKNVSVTHTLQLLEDNSLFYCAKGWHNR